MLGFAPLSTLPICVIPMTPPPPVVLQFRVRDASGPAIGVTDRSMAGGGPQLNDSGPFQ